MTCPLAESDLRFATPDELDRLNRSFEENGGRDIPTDGDFGFLLEINVEFDHNDERLMELFAEYPPLTTRRTVHDSTEYSPFMTSLAKKYQLGGDREKKLIADVHNKFGYICCIDNAKLYASIGVKVTAITNAAVYRQSKWLANYILYNNSRRSECQDSFSRSFYKNMNSKAG